MIQLLSIISVLALGVLGVQAQVAGVPSAISVNRGSWRSVIMPHDDVRLSAQTDGVIMAYPHLEGDRVKKGDVLVVLDDRAEKVQVANAQASLRRATAERVKAQKDFARVKSLYDDRIASDKQFLEATFALEQAEASFSQAEQSVAMAELQLDYRYIKSPIDGLFFKKTKSVGEAVQRLEVAARVIDDSSLEMVVYGSPQYFGQFAKGDTFDVQLLDGPFAGEKALSRVRYVDTLIDPASGTFRIKLDLTPSPHVYAGLGALLLPETVQHTSADLSVEK